MRNIYQIYINSNEISNHINKNLLDGYKGVSSIGIQAKPNTKIYLTKNSDGTPNLNFPIVIGNTGIYQVDLKDYGTISYLALDKNTTTENENTTTEDIIIDILCVGKE